MEVLTRVDLDLPAMRRVVEREGGCVVWGGAVSLSPVDDLLIRIERALDIDSDGQLVASVLSPATQTYVVDVVGRGRDDDLHGGSGRSGARRRTERRREEDHADPRQFGHGEGDADHQQDLADSADVRQRHQSGAQAH